MVIGSLEPTRSCEQLHRYRLQLCWRETLDKLKLFPYFFSLQRFWPFLYLGNCLLPPSSRTQKLNVGLRSVLISSSPGNQNTD